MKITAISPRHLAFLAVGVAGLLSGCEKGPAEKVGQKIDNAVDPRGPAEKVGDKIDKATGK